MPPRRKRATRRLAHNQGCLRLARLPGAFCVAPGIATRLPSPNYEQAPPPAVFPVRFQNDLKKPIFDGLNPIFRNAKPIYNPLNDRLLRCFSIPAKNTDSSLHLGTHLLSGSCTADRTSAASLNLKLRARGSHRVAKFNFAGKCIPKFNLGTNQLCNWFTHRRLGCLACPPASAAPSARG